MSKLDSTKQKKSDNSLNNRAEELAWDRGVLKSDYKRVFVAGVGETLFVQSVIARRPETKSEYWILERGHYDLLSHLQEFGEVSLILVCERTGFCESIDWDQLLFIDYPDHRDNFVRVRKDDL